MRAGPYLVALDLAEGVPPSAVCAMRLVAVIQPGGAVPLWCASWLADRYMTARASVNTWRPAARGVGALWMPGSAARASTVGLMPATGRPVDVVAGADVWSAVDEGARVGEPDQLRQLLARGSGAGVAPGG